MKHKPAAHRHGSRPARHRRLRQHQASRHRAINRRHAAVSDTLVIEPGAGFSPVYRIISGARHSIDVTMYELADTRAEADLTAAEEGLKVLGVDKDHPSGIVNVYAPISGVIIAQNVTMAAAAGVNLSGSATAFTIADLTSVWIICDVYENDIPKITVGQSAQIRLTAYPDKVLTGRVSDIGPVLDPNIRTAKIRIEIPNPGNILKLGMFVTATFESKKREKHPVVSADAVLHLHDRDWVFIPAGGKQFKRIEVQAGKILPGNKQELLSGINPGEQVVSNVLQLEATLETQ